MQYVINSIRLLTAALATFLIACTIALIPPKYSPAQSPPIPEKDTVLDKFKEVVNRVEAVSSKVDYAATMVDSNAVKAQEIVTLLDRLKLKNKSMANLVPRVVYVDKPTPEAPKDKSPYVDAAYISRPILIFDACRYTYGGDSFRTNMWKAPGEDGLIKQLFKKKKNKTIAK